MNIYNWHSQQPIDDGFVGITRFSISSTEDLPDGRKHVTGRIQIVDYIEAGIKSEDPWESFGTKQPDNTFLWEVGCADATAFWREPDTGKPAFTASPEVNADMKTFINAHLRQFALKASAH